MTARYARLHDQTLKREALRWHERVNRRGERIALPAGGPLEEAAWMKGGSRAPARRCPTATAACRWFRPARTPTPF